jgi:RNA polymerase sigma factor (sigma-70 family)
MDEWMSELRRGDSEAAWDVFLTRHRRLMFAAIRHYAQDYDEVMDIFAWACEALRENDLRRLRSYADEPAHRARFSTWLVTVVRHLTIDWFRQRDGRPRLSVAAEALPPLQRSIFRHVFLDRRSHLEAFELIRTGEAPAISFRAFLVELRATYKAVTGGRRGQLFRDVGVPPPAHAEPEAAAVEPGEPHELLKQVLDSLSPEDRVAIQLYVLDELPAEEVARVLGLASAKAVYNRVYRVLTALRTRLAAAGITLEDLQ